MVFVPVLVTLISGTAGYLLGTHAGGSVNRQITVHPKPALHPATTIAKQILEPILPTATPFPVPSIDISNWQTYVNAKDHFTMKYPADWCTQDVPAYEGGGTEKYIADSQASVEKWQSHNETMLTNQNIIVEPLYFATISDDGYTENEKLEKQINLMFGTEKPAGKNQPVPWVNDNNGSFVSAPPYAKLTIDGRPAARIRTNGMRDIGSIGTVTYIIMNGDILLELSAIPTNSVFIPFFDKMISTIKFLPQPSPTLTNPASISKESWKTCASPDGSYSFLYPPQWAGSCIESVLNGGAIGVTFNGLEGDFTVAIRPLMPLCQGSTQSLQIQGRSISACDVVNPNGSETWQAAVNTTSGEKLLFIEAIAAAPAQVNRNLLLEIFSTLAVK